MAAYEIRRTPRRPKYSLMTSVRMKTIGQISTPAVKLSDPDWPNRFQPNGGRPSVVSSAKILTPTNSATTALPTKNAVSSDEEPRRARPEQGHGHRGIPCVPGWRIVAAELTPAGVPSGPRAGPVAHSTSFRRRRSFSSTLSSQPKSSASVRQRAAVPPTRAATRLSATDSQSLGNALVVRLRYAGS